MFLAIVNDAYSEVKAEMSRQKHEFEMVDFFKKVCFYYSMISILIRYFFYCAVLVYNAGVTLF